MYSLFGTVLTEHPSEITTLIIARQELTSCYEDLRERVNEARSKWCQKDLWGLGKHDLPSGRKTFQGFLLRLSPGSEEAG